MSPVQEASALEDAEQLEFQAGRRAPYSQVGDWVVLAPIRHPAARLYWLLSAHINSSRDDTVVWPTQDALAEMLGLSDGRKVRPYLNELVALDAISVKRVHRYVGGLRRARSVYVVHQSPPEGYEGLESLREFYTARKARIEAEQARQAEEEAGADDSAASTGAADTDPTPGGPNEPPGKSAETAGVQGAEMGPLEGAEMGPLVRGRNGPPNKTKKNQTKENSDEGGGQSAAPRTPAVLTAGHFETVVTDQLELISNQQTARAKNSASAAKTRSGETAAARGTHDAEAAGLLGAGPGTSTIPDLLDQRPTPDTGPSAPESLRNKPSVALSRSGGATPRKDMVSSGTGPTRRH